MMAHYSARNIAARYIARKLQTEEQVGNVKKAFLRNTRPLRSIFQPSPAGWSSRARNMLATVKADASKFVQTMNDRYTNPSGMAISAEPKKAEVIAVREAEPRKENIAS